MPPNDGSVRFPMMQMGQRAASPQGRCYGICSQQAGAWAPEGAEGWIDWIGDGMELLGCDHDLGQRDFGVATALEDGPAEQPWSRDYSKLHDDFLESLLHEQTKPLHTSLDDDSVTSATQLHSHPPPPPRSTAQTTEKECPPSPGKRRHSRSKRHHRRLSLRSSRMRVADVGAPKRTKNYDRKDSVTVSLADLAGSNSLPPSTYIHPKCRMQKDKGKGEPVGSNICAKDLNECLLKLQQKMELLTNVALGDGRKGSATMKRRKARVSEILPNFTETRSLIELRMGFVTMTYGVLLRWDSTNTGKITLVVLRKMCHESFYPKESVTPKTPPRKILPMSTKTSSPFAVRNVIGGKHAVMQRPNGMEVALLDPPYRVARPDVFAPSVLSASLICVEGLSHGFKWVVKLVFDEIMVSKSLRWNPDRRQFLPDSDECIEWEVSPQLSLDLGAMEVSIVQHRLGRISNKRAVATMSVPLAGLEPFPSQRVAEYKQLTVPLKHDPKASITLAFAHQSDYAHWLYREVEARRREEVRDFVWKAPFYRVEAPEEDEQDDPWEWICSIC